MAITERLALLIQASTGGAVKGLKEVASAAKDMGAAENASAKELAALERKAAAAGETLKSGLGISSLQSKLSGLGPAGVKASAGLDKIVGSLSSIGPAALGVGAAAGVGLGLLAKYTAEGVAKFQSYVADAKKYARITGESAESSSLFASALRKVGVDADTGARSLFMLAKNTEGHAAKLAADGIAVAKDADGHTRLSETLLRVSDAYIASGGGAAGAKIAADAFGKSGQALLPLLAKGREGIKGFFEEAEKHHMVFSDKDFENAKQLSLATKNLHESMDGLEVELARGVVPWLAKFTAATTHGIENVDHFAHSVGNANDWVKKHTGGHVNLAHALGNSLAHMNPLTGAIADLGSGHHKAKKDVDDTTGAIKNLTTANAGLATSFTMIDRIDPLAKLKSDLAGKSLLYSARTLGDSIMESLGQGAYDSAYKAQKKIEQAAGNFDEKKIADAADKAGQAARDAYLKPLEDIGGKVAQFLDVGDAWSKLEQDGTASISALNKKLEEQISALGDWQTNLVKIAARGGEGFARELEKMGPQSATLVAAIAKKTGPEFERLTGNFTSMGTLSGNGFAAALDSSLSIAAAIARSGGTKTAEQIAAGVAGGIANVTPQLIALVTQLAGQLQMTLPIDVQVRSSTGGGGQRKAVVNAYGNIYDRPTLGIFGEAGPEMILPLGPNKRKYAQALLRRSGLLPQFANGAVVNPAAGLSALSMSSSVNSTTAVSLDLNVTVVANDAAGGRAAGKAAAAEMIGEFTRYFRNNPRPDWAKAPRS